MLKKLYLSPLGYLISILQNFFAIFQKPFMVYGCYNSVQNKFMKYSRISSNTKIMSRNKLDISDNVWIGYYSLLDASNSIKIGEGVQTGSHISIFTHSSHNAIRLMGEKYIENNSRLGYIEDEVIIGNYSFLGTGTIIFPGVTIGRGCLIKAGSVITKSFSDYSIIAGNPAIQVGNTIDIDKKYFTEKIVQENYYDKLLIIKWLENKENINANTIS